MKEIAVLVQPLEECPENFEACYNCGSNIMRVLNSWCILTDEYCKETSYPRVMHYDVTFICAVCNKSVSGHSFFDIKNIERVKPSEQEILLNDFRTKEEAEEWLRENIKSEII